jgi:hypothetical protein
MKQLAIIGAGQLGSRHLQGLARTTVSAEITVVDPFPASIELARQRFEEMPANPAITNIRYVESIDALPSRLDYVIVATTADVRLEVLRKLLTERRVANVLLEKVLFQHVDEYAQAQALLDAANSRAWVNCPRRVFSIYRDLRNFFANDRLLSFSTAGGNWGLGCNSIHFIDLFAQFADAFPDHLNSDGLDRLLIPSKRKNFKEFNGTLRGRIGSAQFEITSFAGTSTRLLTTIRAEQRSCVIDEAAGKAFLFDGKTWQEKAFTVPFLSELGAEVAAEILTNGECGLTPFAESVGYHLPLLRCLGAHVADIQGGDPEFCPVT